MTGDPDDTVRDQGAGRSPSGWSGVNRPRDIVIASDFLIFCFDESMAGKVNSLYCNLAPPFLIRMFHFNQAVDR